MDLYTLPSSAVAGTIFLSKKLDTSKDIVISFEYACYGTEVSGSEGFCVFFYDTYAKTLTGGGPGPGLCYTTTFGISAEVNNQVNDTFYGVGYGQMGIGFDLTGNFSTSAFGLDGFVDGTPNTITVRGSQTNQFLRHFTSSDLSTSAYNKPLSLYQQVSSLDDIKYYKMRIRLTDFCKTLIIDCQHPGDLEYTNYINTLLPENWPVSVNSCLSFATGQTNTCFSIKNFNVNGIFTSLTAVPDVNLWTYYGACYLGQDPNPVTMTVYDTISVVNAPPYDVYPPLIFVSPGGTAPLQSSDDFVTVAYGTSSTFCLGDDYDLRLGGTLSADARRRLFNFIAEMVGWRMWGNLVDGWILGSTFNKGYGRTAYALKNDTNNAYLLSSESTGSYPTWETEGIRFYDEPQNIGTILQNFSVTTTSGTITANWGDGRQDILASDQLVQHIYSCPHATTGTGFWSGIDPCTSPSFPSNFKGTRLEVPNWTTRIEPPMSVVAIVKPYKSSIQGSCIFGQTSYGSGAYHYGFNGDYTATNYNFNIYNGMSTTINGESYPNATLSSYYALFQITDKQSNVVRKYLNNYTGTPNALVATQALTGIGFGYDITGFVNRPYDGEIAAAFVFNKEIDKAKFFEIYTNTIGQSLSLGFPSYP